jgi:hypothetical protein
MARRVLTVAATLSLVLMACGSVATSPAGGPGGGGAGSSTGPTPPTGGGGSGASGDPCALLTQAEVSAALGVAVGPGTAAQGETHGCDWQYPPSGGPQEHANLVIDVGTPFAGLCNGPSGAVTIIPVSGVGDGACFTQVVGLGGWNLNFEKGSEAYSVSVGLAAGASDAAIQAADKTLALDAVAKL